MEIKNLKSILPEVVFWDGQAWKKIEGYINTYFNPEGEIGLLNSQGFIIKPSQIEMKTTKGTYLYVKVIDDEFTPVTKAIHQLICKAANGNPPNDGKIYEPNHIDANKHNNKPSNLEWLTRSGNILHAYNNGHCLQGLRIEAHNVNTHEIKYYHTLSAMAREWCIPRHSLRNIISRHRSTPWEGQWLFVLDDSSDKKVSRYQKRDVAFKDYVSGVITIVDSFERAGSITCVNPSTIRVRLNPKTSKSSNSLLSRYVFKLIDDKTEWPKYSVAEALESEKKYQSNLSS
jgi:hypothetical protein